MAAKSLTPEERDALVAAATAAREKAAAPYSHFHVGAALLAEDGRDLPGLQRRVGQLRPDDLRRADRGLQGDLRGGPGLPGGGRRHRAPTSRRPPAAPAGRSSGTSAATSPSSWRRREEPSRRRPSRRSCPGRSSCERGRDDEGCGRPRRSLPRPPGCRSLARGEAGEEGSVRPRRRGGLRPPDGRRVHGPRRDGRRDPRRGDPRRGRPGRDRRRVPAEGADRPDGRRPPSGLREHPHPRRDEPPARHLERPAPHGVAHEVHLPGRGEERLAGVREGGDRPRLPRDDPGRDDDVRRHVLLRVRRRVVGRQGRPARASSARRGSTSRRRGTRTSRSRRRSRAPSSRSGRGTRASRRPSPRTRPTRAAGRRSRRPGRSPTSTERLS